MSIYDKSNLRPTTYLPGPAPSTLLDTDFDTWGDPRWGGRGHQTSHRVTRSLAYERGAGVRGRFQNYGEHQDYFKEGR